jgi:hypothetical protein
MARRKKAGKLKQSSLGIAELGFRLLVQELPAAKPSSSSAPRLSEADLKRQLKMW